VPAGAQATFGASSFPLGLDGLLWIEGLGESASLRVTWADGACRAALRRPAGDDPVPDLGDVRCD